MSKNIVFRHRKSLLTAAMLLLSLSAGHAPALAQDLLAWGGNAYGQLGNGTFTTEPPYSIATPVPVTGLTDIVAVEAGYAHSLALRSDGAVFAWGDNFYGQLGIGTFTTSPFPARVTGLSGVVAIAARGQVWPAYRDLYTKIEYRIPMRDGTRLYTSVHVPKNRPGKHPILLERTPYGANGLRPDAAGLFTYRRGARGSRKFLTAFRAGCELIAPAPAAHILIGEDVAVFLAAGPRRRLR
jgi:hypothetical protein